MTIKLGVVMDPIESIHYNKDSTLAMLWEAAHRGWSIYYFTVDDLFLRDGTAFGHAKIIQVYQDPKTWFKVEAGKTIPLAELNVILMRKDPPVDVDYIHATQLLEFAERAGVKVMNKPQALRDANEKIAAQEFPHCCPPTLVSKQKSDLKKFMQEHGDIVCKPLNNMGGRSVFYLHKADVNASAVFETLTENETRFIMAQRFIPEIKQGDKRILMINGEPVPYALARVPAAGELRGNLAAGAKGIAQPLTERDRWICTQVGPALREKGLLFVGLDVIGDYLTEINVTSPTCIRELDEQCGLTISKSLMDCLVGYL